MADPQEDPAPPRPRLLLADVDGTLVTKEKILTERAKASVKKVRSAGVEFAVTSGRPPRGMSMLIEPLEITTVEAVIKIIEEHGLGVWIYRGNDWFVHERHGAHVDREEWTVKFPPKVVASYDGKTDDVAKIVGVSDDLDAVVKCEKAVQAAFQASVGTKKGTPQRDHSREDDATARKSTVSAARSQPYYLDVTHPDANKGGVVTALARMLNQRPEEIATIGDMPNDVSMFEKGGLAIAMGQSSDEVKAAAHEVTTSSEDEGFANAVERFILKAG